MDWIVCTQNLLHPERDETKRWKVCEHLACPKSSETEWACLRKRHVCTSSKRIPTTAANTTAIVVGSYVLFTQRLLTSPHSRKRICWCPRPQLWIIPESRPNALLTPNPTTRPNFFLRDKTVVNCFSHWTRIGVCPPNTKPNDIFRTDR